MSAADLNLVNEPLESPRAFIRRVKLKHFRSIAQCDVTLAPLSVLVGRNSAGKSNFLDSLLFVRDSLDRSLDHAIKARGGIDEVRRRSNGRPHSFGMELEIHLGRRGIAIYGFEIESKKGGGFSVGTEHLRLEQPNQPGGRPTFFDRRGSVIDASIEHPPQALADRLYLVHASGFPDYRDVYNALLSMGFYEFNPEVMKQLQSPRPDTPLQFDGANIASVLGRMQAETPQNLARLNDYLRTIAPRMHGVERIKLGPKETFVYREEIKGVDRSWRFYASSMSDGMLRALGILVAINQPGQTTDHLPLIGIEEPEMALHPAAVRTLVEALREAADHSQVVVTTHSPELIDELEIPPDRLLVVSGGEGVTKIAPADSGSREAIRRHLSTPGELLRMDQLQPDADVLDEQERQFTLFSRPA